jgi:hypothetical protein
LLAVVSELRDVWADVIEMSPVLAARFNAAARLANSAAAALQADVIR